MKRALILALCLPISAIGFKIDRVILGCDANPMYLEFWPVVAKTWKELVGVKPTLGLIASKDVYIDESLGDVIRFEPIPGVSTAFQAQVIRLLLPILFENEVCIISDMDMIPCQRNYFVNSVADIPDDCFVVYKNGAFNSDEYKEYPMCYNAALGKTFKEIFNIQTIEQMPTKINEWYSLGLGWTSDQQILYAALDKWDNKDTKLVKLGHDVHPRIDRAYWMYNEQNVKRNYYIDSHMLRPYSLYSKHIDQLVALLLSNYTEN
jgi:hypothetical protein